MKSRQLASLLFTFFLIAAFSSFGQSRDEILGTWYNTEKTAQVDIMEKDGAFLGKISWLKEPIKNGEPAKDVENDDKKLQQRPLMGLTILEGLFYKDGIWKGGKIYDPKSGNTYSCEIRLKSKDVLEVKGYMGFSWIGRTVEWTRVNK
ncbi:DUF2147 domain-containing protein [Algoriphagus algorifonticola]|uniref:DUF2147 domain-containing protein n=1 Tax=Algoriphagus algorifonticola TaxID=2593007 RepID=UPI00119EFD52|nr:DUF2147 domain-containing protein [Algoriphagus algorifonticola]